MNGNDQWWSKIFMVVTKGTDIKFVSEKRILSFNRSSSMTNISHPPQQFNSMVPFDAIGPQSHALINQLLFTIHSKTELQKQMLICCSKTTT